jgi:UDP-galactose transporter
MKVKIVSQVELTEENEVQTFLRTGGGEKNGDAIEPAQADISKSSNLTGKALLALGILVLQNAGVALIGRFALGSKKHSVDTVVVTIELFKMLIATAGCLWETKFNVSSMAKDLLTIESLKMAVPAFLYFVQNNLVLMSLERLPTAIFQVTYQCKILTTAFFSVVWLGRSINKMQVGALLLLTAGVAVVQCADVKPSEGDYTVSDQVAGFVYVLIACCLSGCAGVYFEWVLKKSSQSIMFRNFQLAGFTLLLGGPIIVFRHRDTIWQQGLTYGYDNVVWTLVILQAVGGFVVATVVKYADQVQKGFAVSFAIVLGSITSMFLFGTDLQFLFWAGGSMVVSSVYFYNFFK